MISLIEHVKKSLFFRLLLIFGITLVLFLLIIWISLQTITEDDNTIQTIPNYFTRNVESVIEDIGAPPNLSNAMRLADELGWTINIRNPIMRWSSNAENRLNVDASQYLETLSNNAEMRTISNEDIIMVKRGGYDFYFYQRFINDNSFNYIVLYIGLTVAAVVLFINYFMVNRLLDPVRLLKRGAERIEKGDLNFRVKSNLRIHLHYIHTKLCHKIFVTFFCPHDGCCKLL